MKQFIKNKLRIRLLEHDNQNDIILSPEKLKQIEDEVNKYYNETQSKISELNTIIQNINQAIENENKNPKTNGTHETTIAFFKEILLQKEQELKNTHLPSKDNLKQYYTNHAIKQARQDNERNDYKQQREKEGITKENLIDLFVTALEGGSNHWYYIKTLPNNVKSAETIGEHILNGGYIQFFDIENTKELLGDVDMNSLLDAIQLLKNKYPNEYENILMEEFDANDADLFLQLCVMGEVVFG